MELIENEVCPFCKQKTLTLSEQQKEIPYFGKVYLFSMTCSNCKYHKADVESIENKGPIKYTLEVSSEDDLKLRVVKSSNATIKIPNIIEVSPGEGSQGFVSNVEGIINRIKRSIEIAKEAEDDKEARMKAIKMLKKINRVLWGQDKLKLIIEDPTGNSAIISDKAIVSKPKA